jgi:hypothetical protein
MPPDDGCRLDYRHSVQYRRKQAVEPDEEQSIRQRQLWPRGYALAQHTQLVSQQHDFGLQLRLRLERRDQHVEEQDQEPDHGSSAYPNSPLTPVRMEFSVRTGGRKTAIEWTDMTWNPVTGCLWLAPAPLPEVH